MGNYLIGLGGFFLGSLAVGVVIGGITKRFVDRLKGTHHLEITQLDLEKRRLSTDYSREHLPRDGAGKAARVVDGMPRTNRSQFQERSKTRTKKIGEAVDTRRRRGL